MHLYPLKQILHSPQKHELILLRWISDQTPTHLPHLKIILEAPENCRERALEYIDGLLYSIKSGNITYPNFYIYMESLRRVTVARKKLAATF